MEQLFAVAALWLALALLSALLAAQLRLSIALVEICIGVAMAACAGWLNLDKSLALNSEWVKFLASAGAVVLTFLAGTELDPDVIRIKLTEVSIVGCVGCVAPFLGCAAIAYYGLGWNREASLLCGVALSTTSMAVVYSVMLETGLNKTEFGKGILGSCFTNDLGTVIVLGVLFAPFTYKTLVFLAATAVVLMVLPVVTDRLTRKYAHRTAAIRTKWIMLILFALGALALWSGSEAVLPAYLAGMVLAGSAGRDIHWIRRLRTLTVGFLTPFYFIRAGTLVSVPSLMAAPMVFVLLLMSKVLCKIWGLYPVIGLFRQERTERWYYTLLMSTGLTFGTISALYGLTHDIVTAIAQFLFVPAHLLPKSADLGKHARRLDGVGDEG